MFVCFRCVSSYDKILNVKHVMEVPAVEFLHRIVGDRLLVLQTTHGQTVEEKKKTEIVEELCLDDGQIIVYQYYCNYCC